MSLQVHKEIQLRDYQIETINSFSDYYRQGNDGNIIAVLPTGCHAAGTKILMFNGTTKLVENVLVGDKLMGPDSKPRTVLNLARGNEQMARITPVKGKPFEVNINHILSLYKVNERSENSGRIYNSTQPAICNISVKDYLKKSKHFKHLHKLRRVSVDFKNNSKLTISPYFLGIYLGDGCGQICSFHSVDYCLIEEFEKELTKFNDNLTINLRKFDYKQNIYVAKIIKFKKSNIYKQLKWFKLHNFNSETAFIPHEYKTASYQDRVELLTGLIDTDGHFCNSGSYDYISKSEQLAADVVYICRSLGLAAYETKCIKGCQNNFVGEYHRVSISGDLSILNCRLKYKQSEVRSQIKKVDITGFKVELIDTDNYYGFELDKDHLYLTGDFIVHHNTGKSAVLGGFVHQTFTKWCNQRWLILSHVEKILTQDIKAIRLLWSDAPLGVYSAGLNSKDTAHPIVVAGVASAVNNIDAFGHRDIIFIDEVHLVSQDENTMYQKIINRLKEINPYLKVIGTTATPYRSGQGLITDGETFDDICIDLSTPACFRRFIDEGYLAPLIPLRTNIEVDTTSIKMMNGDFAVRQLEDATEKVIYEAVKESLPYIYARNCGLTFCSGIKTSEMAAEILQSFGVSAVAIHSKLTAAECDKRFTAFESGEIKVVCGNEKFTTGYDFPPIDFCLMLRSTMSTSKWIQMLGRLTRPYDFNNPQQYVKGFDYVKRNALVLDFAGNRKRLGPIDAPNIPTKKGDKVGDAPIRICEEKSVKEGSGCGMYNHASARYCGGKPYPSDEGCGAEFIFKTKLVSDAGTAEFLSTEEPVIETFDVTRVIYHKHNSKKNAIGVPCLKVSYYCGLQRHSEYVPFEAKGMIKNKAAAWWMQRSSLPVPITVDDALIYVSQLRCPKRINVQTDLQYPEIKSVEW